MRCAPRRSMQIATGRCAMTAAWSSTSTSITRCTMTTWTAIVFACKGDLLNDPAAAELKRPAAIAKDAWRQLMPTLRVIGATLELR
ncbi:hypothetical protein G6F50_018399 [Rhizopus delemar]|uniref:Uncharacterized protein n=1 Tax=Rhizopus delemar TaxID=936053 RepID=A0A9P6XND4_9FUNG|nr:hypothetical protein G6F50_018399 [Rhizopus delemar]